MKDDEKIVKVDLLDVLLDDYNTAPIYMYDDRGRQMKFEQVAVISDSDGDLFCILKPITKIDGVGENEAIVFKVDEDERGESFLRVETNEKKSMEIFAEYYKLLEEV